MAQSQQLQWFQKLIKLSQEYTFKVQNFLKKNPSTLSEIEAELKLAEHQSRIHHNDYQNAWGAYCEDMLPRWKQMQQVLLDKSRQKLTREQIRKEQLAAKHADEDEHDIDFGPSTSMQDDDIEIKMHGKGSASQKLKEKQFANEDDDAMLKEVKMEGIEIKATDYDNDEEGEDDQQQNQKQEEQEQKPISKVGGIYGNSGEVLQGDTVDWLDKADVQNQVKKKRKPKVKEQLPNKQIKNKKKKKDQDQDELNDLGTIVF